MGRMVDKGSHFADFVRFRPPYLHTHTQQSLNKRHVKLSNIVLYRGKY